MNPVSVAMLVIIPAAVALVAVMLALTCKYHPRTQFIILPDYDQNDDPTDTSDQMVSDVKSKRDLLNIGAIALGIVLGMSLVLVAITHAEYFSAILQPLVRLFEDFDQNTVIAVIVAIILLFQAPGLLGTCFTWITPWRRVGIAAVFVGVYIAWISIDSWVTLDLIAAVLCISTILMFQPRISFLRLSLILLIGAFLYDAVQVYGTGNMESLARAATPTIGASERELMIPMLFIIPRDLSFESFGLLGLGDVVVLGVMAVAAARLGKKIGSRMPLVLTFAGFAVAMTVCYAVMWHFKLAQPATIYIVPLCALPVILYVWRRSEFSQLSMPFFGTQIKSTKTKAAAVNS